MIEDQLLLFGTAAGQIVCTLDNLGGSATITLESSTCEQIEGTRFDSFWPPEARA